MPDFNDFTSEVESLCNSASQSGPLRQRLQLLESIVHESERNAGLAEKAAPLESLVAPGVLVLADLTDPLLSSADASAVFGVLLEQFRRLDVAGAGKLVVLDEAHRCEPTLPCPRV